MGSDLCYREKRFEGGATRLGRIWACVWLLWLHLGFLGLLEMDFWVCVCIIVGVWDCWVCILAGIARFVFAFTPLFFCVG